MPAIRKIRIVNFRFNDNSKLIPDEIFFTENDEGMPIDTLLDLDNGGGKSVIVQLLLQPVCPKAKVQNRNISDYFQKGTDHAFVLLEWKLDNSPNSLLTGIAIAASTTADDETESKTIRYYTFLHDHAVSGGRIDLMSLPLTEKTGSRIRPMSYDELRKYLQNRKVEYYPSDSLHIYHKRLEEYGIIHAEWENILVRINSVEGGIPKFFEEYRTADRLLDKFIIPGVMPNDTASAQELEDMFINYADSYAGQEENLRLREHITAFTKKLEGMLPLIKNMWDAEDSRIKAIHLLADHLFTLENNIKLDTEEYERLERSVSDQEAKIYRIKTEKASEAFYIAKENFEKAAEQLKECEDKKYEAERRYKNSEHMVKILNAAKEYAELLEQQNSEKALTARIRELEQGMREPRILSIKYSLYLLTDAALKQSEQDLELQNKAEKEYKDKIFKIQQALHSLKERYTEENNVLNQTIGTKDNMLEQISEGLNALDLYITVMLDGEYSENDIADIRANYDKQLKLADEETQKYRSEKKLLEEELDAQDITRSELLQKHADREVCLKQQENALEQYREAYRKAAAVLEHLSIPESRIFTDEPKTTIGRIIADLNEQLGQSERIALSLGEKIRCIETGQLHISKTAADFLKETGISFQTGEQYLDLQNEKIREDILSAEPLAAYSVIVNSEKEKEKLLSQPAETWLPSIVPLYTRSEIADMADGNWNETKRFLSAYDRDYFHDTYAYKEHIQKSLDEARTDIENIKHRLNEWEEERKILSQFSYAADHEQRSQEDISACRKELQKIQNELLSLDDRKKRIKERIEKLRELEKTQQEKKRGAEKDLSDFERICGLITRYESIVKDISKLEENCGRLSAQIETELREEQRLNELTAKCSDSIDLIRDKTAGYRELLNELKGSPESEKLSGNYSELLAEYRLYREKYSADLQEPDQRLKKTRDIIRRKEKEIQRFHIERSEYENVTYSDKAYDLAEKQREQANRASEQASRQHLKAAELNAAAESVLKQAEKQLDELKTEPLPRAEVGSDFERRIGECETELSAHKENMQECKKRLDKLNADHRYAADWAERFTKELSEYTPKISDAMPDTKSLYKTIESCGGELKRAENKTKEYHRRELEVFRDTYSLFTGTLDGILSVIDNDNIAGDRYFTLYERTEGDIKRYRDRITQLDIQLKDVEDSRKQLVDNCFQRAERLYDKLNELSNRSKIRIGGGKKQMLRIELPAVGAMSEQPKERIDEHIAEQVKKYLSEQQTTVRTHRSHLDIRRLLNCYIGRDSIPITVFKIDKNIRSSSYRSWQDALKANSGGEQFVVFFSLIVSVMNYTRSLTNSLDSASGVLILDNPFGPISSPHLLGPMFSIARHFHIQLICLTHLGTADVTSFFDMVYRLRFRYLPLSNVQILESEPKQHMEHAYYFSEQLSLF